MSSLFRFSCGWRASSTSSSLFPFTSSRSDAHISCSTESWRFLQSIASFASIGASTFSRFLICRDPWSSSRYPS
ncbi:hypothetical protein ZEAMMB73_Zm00001d013821 [Zea mays]|uniref:Uncharacterized protein n=1 Tax=Zea mays TaxID=4577 RepID=A0A1D6GMF1_MAIZE|nr:hypothetical protein ZEAMMB73_Zm00001d013821 [Zea mays]